MTESVVSMKEAVVSMEVLVASSALELSELLAQLAISSETSVSRQKAIRLRANGCLIGTQPSCAFRSGTSLAFVEM